jgi:DNA-binding NtrC family response regulator
VSDDRADNTSATISQGQRRALLLDTDLFFAVKVSETLKHAGYTTRTARRLSDFTEALVAARPEIALVNTAARGVEWRAAIRAAREAGVPLVAFGSHVDIETQEQARQAGATAVIANSKLASDLPGVVARALRRHASVDAADAEDAHDEAGGSAH